MKTLQTTTVKRTSIALFAVLFFATFLMPLNTKAAETQNEKHKVTKVEGANLIAGIKSSNYGLKRDCIYLAAVNDVKEAIDALKDELQNENDPRTRVLITLALYKLGDIAAVDEVYLNELNYWNSQVQLLSGDIMKLYGDKENPVAASSDKR